MASEVGAKSSGTGCWDCWAPKPSKKDQVNPLAISTPHPLTRSTKELTDKDIVDFAKLVKADELDEKMEEQNADESLSSEEIKTVEVVYSKIHGVKEKKHE